MWAMLLKVALGFLGEFLLAFVRQLRAARADDKNFIEVASRIVRDIGGEHPEWPGDMKRAYARDAIKIYAKGLGRDLGDSLVNTLIEVAVQNLKAKEVAG